MHEEKVNFTGIVDEEDLVAGWSQVLGLLVGAIADLYRQMLAIVSLPSASRPSLVSSKQQTWYCAELSELRRLAFGMAA